MYVIHVNIFFPVVDNNVSDIKRLAFSQNICRSFRLALAYKKKEMWFSLFVLFFMSINVC